MTTLGNDRTRASSGVGSPEGICGTRVRIIGINFSPEHSGVGPYTTGFLEHVLEGGAVVDVATGVPHYPQWRVPREYRFQWRAREIYRSASVVRYRHYVPKRQSALRRGLYEATFLLQVLSSASDNPSAIIGIVPSLSGGIAARLTARRLKIPYGVIFQDLMGRAAAESGITGGRHLSNIVTRLESWVASEAKIIGYIAPQHATYLERIGADRGRLFALPNWVRVVPPQVDRQKIRDHLQWAPNETIITHAGNMGLKQDLDVVLGAARLVQDRSLPIRFILVGDGSERHRLMRAAARLSCVEFVPPQPEGHFLEMLVASDALLLSEKTSVAAMSLPSKLTTYYACGRPVIAAVDPHGTSAEELRRAGCAAFVEPASPDALIGAIMALRRDPSRSSLLSARGLREARGLNESLAADRAAAFVRQLIAEPTPNGT